MREVPTDYRLDAHFAYQRNVRSRIVDIYEEAVNGTTAWRAFIEGESDQLAIEYSDDALGLLGGVGAGAEPEIHPGRTLTLQPEWYQENKWLIEEVSGFALPDEVEALLASGQEAEINLGVFRNAFVEGRKRYAYRFESDTVLESKFVQLGDDTRTPTALANAVRQMEGFEDVTADDFVDLHHYGADLIEDITDAVDKAERAKGWADPREWDTDELTWTEGDGTERVVSISGIRSRLRMARALSNIDNSDGMDITEDDYAGSRLQRWFGDLEDPVPQPPPLDTFVVGKTRSDVTFDQLDIIDGDTIAFMGDEGDVPFRIVGLAAPESTQPGFNEAREGLQQVLRDAETVSIVIWRPDMFGTSQRFFNEQEGVIVHRDRYFAWVYVDGVPLFDPSLFTPTNTRGIKTGGDVPDYVELLAQQRENDD